MLVGCRKLCDYSRRLQFLIESQAGRHHEVGGAAVSPATGNRAVPVADSLNQNAFHQLAMNIGKAIVPTLEAKRQAGVIDPQQMQQRGVEIVYMHWVLDDIEAKFIGLAMHMARSDAASRQPHAVRAIVVITSVITALDHGSSPKLATPDQ